MDLQKKVFKFELSILVWVIMCNKETWSPHGFFEAGFLKNHKTLKGFLMAPGCKHLSDPLFSSQRFVQSMWSNKSMSASDHYIREKNTGRDRWVERASTCFPFRQPTVFQIKTCFLDFNWFYPHTNHSCMNVSKKLIVMDRTSCSCFAWLPANNANLDHWMSIS